MKLTTLLHSARNNRARSLVFSLILIAAAVALRVLTPITLSYVTFYPAVILATVAGGWVFGVGALVVSTVCAVLVIPPLAGSPAPGSFSFWNVSAFWIVCLLIIWLTDVLIDLLMMTEEKADKLVAADKRQNVLMRELSHRMKNQYAVILAMARAVGHQSTSVPEFQEVFSNRLHSMSRAHDLLTQRDWNAVSLRDLIAAELEAFSPAGRLTISGDDVWLKEHAVVNIGMALHELATNATKYGAWSTSEGRVIIGWTVELEGLRFEWKEKAGPQVRSSERKGFGSRMLEKIVPLALQGSASLEFPPEGLCWNLTVPSTCLEIGGDHS